MIPPLRQRAAQGALRAPAPAVRLPPRPLRAADQGPFDWLVPFIPPFLRVNRETREMIWSGILHAVSPDAIKGASVRIALFLNQYKQAIIKYLIIAFLWISGLQAVHHYLPEFATTYVIVSGFIALGVHSLAGDGDAATTATVNGESLSAYSVFNKGGKRMMGSISAEQFENEIRHRGPGHIAGGGANDSASGEEDEQEQDEYDPDLLEALRQSLEEKKREERRLRRTRKR